MVTSSCRPDLSWSRSLEPYRASWRSGSNPCCPDLNPSSPKSELTIYRRILGERSQRSYSERAPFGKAARDQVMRRYLAGPRGKPAAVGSSVAIQRQSHKTSLQYPKKNLPKSQAGERMLSHLANSLVRFGRGARCLRPCDGLHDRTSPEAAAVSGDAPPVRRSAPWTRQQPARSGCTLQVIHERSLSPSSPVPTAAWIASGPWAMPGQTEYPEGCPPQGHLQTPLS